MTKPLAVLSLLLPFAAPAQDTRNVFSPDHNLEFRVFVAPQDENSLIRIAYQVFYRSQPLIQTSFLALDIWPQEPMLGESTGLISSRNESHGDYNTLFANYMQNGSLGRLLTIEARAGNNSIAFRYVIPKSTPLIELLIADEATEFALPKPTPPGPSLPYVVEQPGPVWVKIDEIPLPGFPAMHLILGDDGLLHTRLAHLLPNPNFLYSGTVPFTCPWRVITLGPTSESVLNPR